MHHDRTAAGALRLAALACLVCCSLPLSAQAAQFEGYVGCSTTPRAAPSHLCHRGDEPGAFFRSVSDVSYDVCVEFPTGRELCVRNQMALAGVSYVSKITAGVQGAHRVTWWVDGQQVASWAFRLAPPKLYFIDVAERVRRKPRLIVIGASQAIERLHHWRGWDGPRAVATGVFPYNNCRPYCAAGKITMVPVTVTLSNPGPCGNIFTYRRLEYVLARNPVGGPRHFSSSFAFACQ
jgi:hypothetical protein